MLVLTVGDGLTLDGDGNRLLGQTLGRSIGKLRREMRAADAQDGVADAFQSALMDELRSSQEVLTNADVEAVVVQANSVAGRQTVPSDSLCVRNWTEPCPDGWEHLDDSACMAPTSYAGGCGHLQRFASASSATRWNFVAACRAPWPCRGADACPEGRDYETCPVDWTAIGSGFCRRGTAVPETKCADVYHFSGMEIGQKQELAMACNLQWRCRASCDRDFSALCPEGWADVLGLCVAPETYTGGCG